MLRYPSSYASRAFSIQTPQDFVFPQIIIFPLHCLAYHVQPPALSPFALFAFISRYRRTATWLNPLTSEALPVYEAFSIARVIKEFIKSIVNISLNYPCRKIWSGRWSAQARNIGSQYWLSILDRWSIEGWMVIAGLYWLVILAPNSLPMIGRESLPELSRWTFKFIMILIMTIKFKT